MIADCIAAHSHQSTNACAALGQQSYCTHNAVHAWDHVLMHGAASNAGEQE